MCQANKAICPTEMFVAGLVFTYSIDIRTVFRIIYVFVIQIGMKMIAEKNQVIMVYPKQGLSGTMIRHVPLSLLYASIELVKAGYEVHLVDARVSQDWKKEIANLLCDNTLCVGISVMSGNPIISAKEIGAYCKSINTNVPVVWGGPHATFNPGSILEGDPNADYVVSGYAIESFFKFCEAISVDEKPFLATGVSWREGDAINLNPAVDKSFEYVDWRDIPYHLIEDYSVYGQLDQGNKIFSMYSAVGCPYQCAFCSSPAQYSQIEGKKWVPLDAIEIANHVQYLAEEYDADYIYFIDDDSFPKLSHVEGVIDEISRRNLGVKLGFRGARINEIKKMSDEFLDKLVAAGTDIMHIGAESGSDRILKMLRKNSTAQEVIECNQKLARHPEITAAYNFMMGIPTETLEDLHKTRDLMLQIIEDHPNCIIFPPNKFRPLPGTELYDYAKDVWDYKMPDTLDEWAAIEVEGEISPEWYPENFGKFCDLLLITSYFADNKISRLVKGTSLFYRFMKLGNKLYRPIALLRLKHGFSQLLVEYVFYKFFSKLMVRIGKLG
jgi:anaerobic magnesium-protoporphyrin IX monomethyl ester cyclase